LVVGNLFLTRTRNDNDLAYADTTLICQLIHQFQLINLPKAATRRLFLSSRGKIFHLRHFHLLFSGAVNDAHGLYAWLTYQKTEGEGRREREMVMRQVNGMI